jgi:ubiquinone/menaquinone biosynthesis C-methylase UbiE
MLVRARARVPSGGFLLGDLHQLPLPDSCVDLVVSGLALSHVPTLAPVMAEFARVLRPGGHLVISDAHHEIVFRGSVPQALGPNNEPGLVATYRHTAGDFLRAALPAGLQPRAHQYTAGASPSPAAVSQFSDPQDRP